MCGLRSGGGCGVEVPLWLGVPSRLTGFQEAIHLPAGQDELRSVASLTTIESENTLLIQRE
jgi:hypothetical protein